MVFGKILIKIKLTWDKEVNNGNCMKSDLDLVYPNAPQTAVQSLELLIL